MVTRLAVAVALLSISMGCGSRREVYDENSRVNVSAPFVNVNVQEEGGVRVRAPFANVDTTSRYSPSEVSPYYQTPVQSAPAQFTPSGAIQSYNPAATTTPFQPPGVISQPTMNRIPPATIQYR